MPRTILFVCTGNLCRSPMTEGFFKRRLEEEGKESAYRVRSAGTWAVEGTPASPNTIHAMAEHGIDLSKHQAHLLTVEDVREADLVVVMEEEHARAILRELPEEEGKVHLLTEVAGREGDVEDPYGADLASYRETAGEILALVEEGFDEILRLADQSRR